MPNWEAIEKDYHAGMSLRVLAAKYGISKSTIHKHCNPAKARIVDMGGTVDGQSMDSGQASTLPSTDIVALAKQLVSQLAQVADVPLDLKEHNLIANALSQYNKIMITAPVNQELPKGIDWSIFEQSELDIIQPIFATAEERHRVELGETTIPQLRKQV
jgi:hypothetical protein